MRALSTEEEGEDYRNENYLHPTLEQVAFDWQTGIILSSQVKPRDSKTDFVKEGRWLGLTVQRADTEEKQNVGDTNEEP